MLVVAFVAYVPVLKPESEWLALVHQCGGHACDQKLMIARRLAPRMEVLPALREIARNGWYGYHGHFYPPDILASAIAGHVEALRRIGADCECTWRYLEESIYPVDATEDNLMRLAENPPALADLVVNFRPVRYGPNPVIFILTENSD